MIFYGGGQARLQFLQGTFRPHGRPHGRGWRERLHFGMMTRWDVHGSPNGHQNHFSLPDGRQSARGLNHYDDVFRPAHRANALDKPELALNRMKHFVGVFVVE